MMLTVFAFKWHYNCKQRLSRNMVFWQIGNDETDFKNAHVFYTHKIIILLYFFTLE